MYENWLWFLANYVIGVEKNKGLCKKMFLNLKIAFKV